MSSIKQSLIQFIPPFDSYFMHFLPFKHLPEVYRPSLSSLLGTREIARKQARVSESALCVWGEGGGGGHLAPQCLVSVVSAPHSGAEKCAVLSLHCAMGHASRVCLAELIKTLNRSAHLRGEREPAGARKVK